MRVHVPFMILMAVTAIGACFIDPEAGAAETGGAIDFTRDVAPILSENCVSCHGPEKQKGGLRLDSGMLLKRGGDTGAPVVTGKPDQSLLFQVVSGAHDELSMPPKGEPLSEAAQQVLATWIRDGAEVPEDEAAPARIETDHWAFQPVERAAVPDADWGNNPIDAFVKARLDEAGVSPSPEADKETLARRLYLDLVGLPPEPDVVEAFKADDSPGAYEALVDDLLASPHFGERWARHWLDLARYADSDGYEKDRPRPYAYRYRDWVINAINADKPYDRFVIEQLAGDLLPNPTLAQKTATGFHRNTLTNREGGIDPEEDRVKQAVDRTNTTAAVFMGVTMACAECHSHKYDPITQREYYGMYAFFNRAMEKNITEPLPGEKEAHERAVKEHEAAVKAKEAELAAYRPKLAEGLPDWEKSLEIPDDGWKVLDPLSYTSIGGAGFKELDDQSVLLVGENPAADTYTVVTRTNKQGLRAIRLQTLKHPDLNESGPGRAHNGNFVLAEFEVLAAPADAPQNQEPVKIAAATASFAQNEYPIESAFDGDLNTGWAIYDGNKTNKDVTAEFTFEEPVGFEAGTIITVRLDHRYGNQHNIGRFRLALTRSDPADIKYPDDVLAALLTPPADRTEAQVEVLLDQYGEQDEHYKNLKDELAKLKDNAPQPIDSYVMTIAANPDPPETHIHKRGDFLSPGAKVEPHTPAIFHPLEPRGDVPDRLDLARWIVDRRNPLTARVAVNRVWEHLFGEGLERISEDFGTRTEKPTHPRLLDWLAASFMEDHAWSRKSLIKQIVMSATYRQSSDIREDVYEKDPANRLLARQNRFRVEAEITRDLFLAASGLLEDSIGGPSIRPPIPDGVVDLGYASSIKWPETEGEKKYRRGLYIFFQRTVAYPMLMAFDCPDSNETALSRNRSNTPLQSLTLLNDPVFVEAAQALGKRLLANGPEDVEKRVDRAFKLCMARDPKPREREMLVKLVEEQQAAFASRPEMAKKLVGPYMPEGVAPETAAAHMVLARSIMNLDEFITRE